ncbi:MAG: ankyrin repeat domain-containing protein [Oligoflexales bacterium]
MINNESPDQTSWTTYYSSPVLPTYSTKPTTNLDQDWALLILDQDLGYDYGWLGMDRNIAVGEGVPGFGSDTIFDAGYSADRSFDTASITDVCEIKKLGSNNQEIYHSCDLQGGASGGPLGRIEFFSGNHYVVGVNAYEKCEKDENPTCMFTNYLDEQANVAVSIDEIRCSLSMDLENYSYELCRRGSTIQHIPDNPIPECAGHNHCDSGEYCSNFKICRFCNDCSSFTSIDGSCFGACNEDCYEHADCDVHNYCDTKFNCYDCNSCELYNDAIDGKCRECLSPTQSPTNPPTSRPTYKPSPLPTSLPTFRPTIVPSFSPSGQPTSKPSLLTDFPTKENFEFTSFPTFSPIVEEANGEILNSFSDNSTSSSNTWLYTGTAGGVFAVAAMTGFFVWKKCFKKSPSSESSQPRIPDLERQEVKTDFLDGKKAMELEEVILDTWAAGDAADVIKLVLKITKENCNYQTKDDKWTPIMILAGLTGAKSIAIAIQEAKFSGSDPAIKDNYGWNALHWAAYYGNAEAAMELVKNKMLLDATDNFGLTPLKTAELEGNEEVVDILRHVKLKS